MLGQKLIEFVDGGAPDGAALLQGEKVAAQFLAKRTHPQERPSRPLRSTPLSLQPADLAKTQHASGLRPILFAAGSGGNQTRQPQSGSRFL